MAVTAFTEHFAAPTSSGSAVQALDSSSPIFDVASTASRFAEFTLDADIEMTLGNVGSVAVCERYCVRVTATGAFNLTLSDQVEGSAAVTYNHVYNNGDWRVLEFIGTPSGLLLVATHEKALEV